jgi:rhamnosyltransferase
LEHPIRLIIPTQNAGALWNDVITGIRSQRGVDLRVQIVDSGSSDHTLGLARSAGFSVTEIAPQEFGHGRTRQLALQASRDSEFVVFMTQDAVLAQPESVSLLLAAFHQAEVAVAYGRQLPQLGASFAARRLREFNYPEQPAQRSYQDRHRLGIRAAFNSNSFAAYRVGPLLKVGGFPLDAPAGEDVLACAALLRAGFKSAYVAQATVYHSHNYSISEEFQRYRAIGEMHAAFPMIIQDFGRPESEGMRFVMRELGNAIVSAPLQIADICLRSIARYAGYRRGLAA